MRFSLILSTLGRRDEVGRFLDSLLRQPLAGQCQVLLVDQNGDDRLADVVAAYAGRLDLHHLRSPARGPSHGRNVGLGHATGELVAFPDDDCEYPDGLLDRVDALFRDRPDLDGVTGVPTADRDPTPAVAPSAMDLAAHAMPLDRLSMFNRCQEFTVFLRRRTVGPTRFNARLGPGTGTPWGSDEGPDFLIRLIDAGARLLYLPGLRVYHPDKLSRITRATLARAASYSRGRGAYFRLHRYPATYVARSLVRPTVGCGLYLARLQPMRSAYYFAIVTGIVRGLCLTRRELADLRAGVPTPTSSAPTSSVPTPDSPTADSPTIGPLAVRPLPLPPLPPRPLVSVLVTNYNYARFLPAALDSVLGQTYRQFEAVVVDDGSTDDSAAVVQRYAERDARVRLVRRANGGQAAALAAAFGHARGEVLCLLDADDVFTPDKLARVVAAFAADPAAGVCNHAARVVDVAGRPIMDRLTAHLDAGWLAPSAGRRGACVYVPTTSCMSFRRQVLAELVPLPAAQRTDNDGYLGMAAQYLTPFAVVDAALADYRIHSTNMGGLTDPTPDRLHYEVALIAARTATLRAFLRGRFGPAVADAVRLGDNPQFVQAALKMHAVAPGHPDVADHPRAALLAAHPNAKWRLVWRAIFATPAFARRRIVPALHRNYRLKALTHQFLVRPARATARPARPPRGPAMEVVTR